MLGVRACCPDRIFKQELVNASPPVFLAAPGKPSLLPPALEKNRGRVGRQGSVGPTDLDASQHRGVLKSDNRKSAQPKTSRARCLKGCLKVCSVSPPVDVTFQATRLSFRMGRPPIHLYSGKWPRGARLARRDEAAWTAGRSHRSSDASVFPDHRSPPRVWRR